jgi:hypothetical protein
VRAEERSGGAGKESDFGSWMGERYRELLTDPTNTATLPAGLWHSCLAVWPSQNTGENGLGTSTSLGAISTQFFRTTTTRNRKIRSTRLLVPSRPGQYRNVNR